MPISTAADNSRNAPTGLSARNAATVTPNDSTDLAQVTRAIFVGGARSAGTVGAGGAGGGGAGGLTSAQGTAGTANTGGGGGGGGGGTTANGGAGGSGVVIVRIRQRAA